MPITVFPPVLTPTRAYDPQTQKYQRISPVNEAMVDSLAKELGGGFAFATIDPVEWTTAVSGAGATAGSGSNIATLVSGTANSGYSTISSATPGRFLHSSANLFRGTLRTPVLSVANNVQPWGVFNYGVKPAITDGFYFSYDGSSNTLSINSAKAGVITSVASGSFNGEVTSYVLDTNVHNYEIIYQVISIYFLIDGVLIHKLKPTTSQLVTTQQFMASAASVNSASGTLSATLEVWSMNILRMTSISPVPLFFHINAAGTNTIKTGPGQLASVIINTPSGAGGSLTIYDSITGSGTVIAVSTTANNSGAFTLSYDVTFKNGLTIVTAGAAGDYTIVYN